MSNLTDEQILDKASHFGFIGNREQLIKFTRAAIAAEREREQSVPDGYVLVPLTTLQRASDSLGAFVSDEGWKQADMDNMDEILAMLSAAPKAPQSDDKRDAERYRWLRAQDNEDFAFSVVKNPHFDVFESAEELDSDIDAAMKKDT